MQAWTVPDEVERLRYLVHLSDSSSDGVVRDRASRGSGINARAMRAVGMVSSFNDLRKDSTAKAT